MKQKGMSLIRMILALGIISAGAAAILALTYSVTKQPIEDAMKAQQTAAIEAVLPPFDNDIFSDAEEITVEGDKMPVTLYPAYCKGKFAGAAVETWSDNGFSGMITLIVGFDLEGTVIDYRILTHAETPGLGAKMEEWFRDSVGSRSILGHNPEAGNFYVTKDPGGDIDGITAATISSRAFLEAVRRASTAFVQYRTQNIQSL